VSRRIVDAANARFEEAKHKSAELDWREEASGNEKRRLFAISLVARLDFQPPQVS
jgi:hypothetical protein